MSADIGDPCAGRTARGDGGLSPSSSAIACFSPHHWHGVNSRYEDSGRGQATARLFQACLLGKAPFDRWRTEDWLLRSVTFPLVPEAVPARCRSLGALILATEAFCQPADHHLVRAELDVLSKQCPDLLGKNLSLSRTGNI